MHEPIKFVIHAYSRTTDVAWAFISSSSVVTCTKPSAHTNEVRNRTKLRYPVFCTNAQTTEGASTWEQAWKNNKPAFFCVIISTQTSTHAYELWNLMKMISSHLQNSRTTKVLWGLICPSLALMACGRTQNDDFQCGCMITALCACARTSKLKYPAFRVDLRTADVTWTWISRKIWRTNLSSCAVTCALHSVTLSTCHCPLCKYQNGLRTTLQGLERTLRTSISLLHGQTQC